MPPERSRKSFLILAASLMTVLAVIIFSQVSLNIPFIRPTDSETTILLFALSVLVSLAFLVFGFILTRNIAKLYIERRSRVLGSKFKFKLVAGALALSLLPVMFLFYSSYALMNRTMDKWFTQPFEQVTRDTRDIVSLLSDYASRKTVADARSAGAVLATGTGKDGAVTDAVIEQAARLHGVDYLLWLAADGSVRAKYPKQGPDLFSMFKPQERTPQRAISRVFFADGAEFAVAVVPVEGRGWLVAGNRLPAGLSDKLVGMQREEDNYQQLRRQHKQVRKTYIGILALVTLIILFITTWVALFLSKQITVPIQHLAAATHAVSEGRLDTRVETRAVDELGVLVESFNQMTAQLQAHRSQLETSRSDLQRANTELEAANAELDRRTRFTEAILESIPTGVISLSRRREIVRINPAVERLFGTEKAGAARELRDLVAGDDLREIERLMKRAVRAGNATSAFELNVDGRKRSVAITAASLLHPFSGAGRQSLGYILVIEDMSDVIYAQQAEAWREVAQRIAHEIKNPLTPIALSAERIRRHIERARSQAPGSPVHASLKVIGECSTLIDQEVSTLQRLVDEFSQLARFPKAQPVPYNLNAVVEAAVAVFNGRLDGVRVELNLCPELPLVNVDPDQFKRVIVNLVDNAAEAMENSLVRDLRITTADRGEAVELCVADTGSGVSAELKEKLFLPYFSTKKRGTGLGLAIVSRVVNEHNGSIRVEENHPAGARFVIELPVPAAGDDERVRADSLQV